MKKTFALALQFAGLGATALVLIATSQRSDCTVTAPASFTVSSTCGPSGVVTIGNDVHCSLQLTGTQSVNLPSDGEALPGPTFASGFHLGSLSPDGGPTVANPDGGARLELAGCTATPSDAGFTLDCVGDDHASTLCSGTLTPGSSVDAGTADAGP